LKTSNICELCGTKVGDECAFAVYKRVIKGKQHFFCCATCADKYEEKDSQP